MASSRILSIVSGVLILFLSAGLGFLSWAWASGMSGWLHYLIVPLGLCGGLHQIAQGLFPARPDKEPLRPAMRLVYFIVGALSIGISFGFDEYARELRLGSAPEALEKTLFFTSVAAKVLGIAAIAKALLPGPKATS